MVLSTTTIVDHHPGVMITCLPLFVCQSGSGMGGWTGGPSVCQLYLPRDVTRKVWGQVSRAFYRAVMAALRLITPLLGPISAGD